MASYAAEVMEEEGTSAPPLCSLLFRSASNAISYASTLGGSNGPGRRAHPPPVLDGR